MEQQMIMNADYDSAELMRCIEDCETCHRICLRMAMNHCLEQGGEHVEPGHFRAMMICAEMSRTTADAMLSSFALHETLCAACSRVCRECAETCERIGDMQECVDACRRCAESCDRMSGTPAHRTTAGPDLRGRSAEGVDLSSPRL
jgi:hypothetical protein